MEKKIFIKELDIIVIKTLHFKLINLFIENKLSFNRDKLIHTFFYKINSNYNKHICFFFRKILRVHKVKSRNSTERTSDFPSSIAITVLVVKTVGMTKHEHNSYETRRKTTKQLPPARGILWRFFSEWHSIFRLVTSRVPPTARTVYARIENTIYPQPPPFRSIDAATLHDSRGAFVVNTNKQQSASVSLPTRSATQANKRCIIYVVWGWSTDSSNVSLEFEFRVEKSKNLLLSYSIYIFLK